MKAKTKKFDAVAESRKWKEAVAKETAGMTPEETMAYFDPVAVRRRFEAALRRAEQRHRAGRRKKKTR
jgi:predicted metalloendopeptidase